MHIKESIQLLVSSEDAIPSQELVRYAVERGWIDVKNEIILSWYWPISEIEFKPKTESDLNMALRIRNRIMCGYINEIHKEA
jgi:hypothetical protein